jgi:hypothetical protein
LQDTTAVGKYLDTRANLTNLVGCFKDLYIMAGKEKRYSCTNTAETSPYHYDLIAVS